MDIRTNQKQKQTWDFELLICEGVDIGARIKKINAHPNPQDSAIDAYEN
jgi:hypothetical protein